MQMFNESSAQSLVPFLPKDFEPESDWLNRFIGENFGVEHHEFLTKQLKFLIHHQLYGDNIKKCLLRLHLFENVKEKKALVHQIGNIFYQRPWEVVTQLLRILARPNFDNSLNRQLFLLREMIIDKIAVKHSNTQLHQYLRFFDQAFKMNLGLLPLNNDKYLIVSIRELTDKKIQELLSHEFSIYNDGPSTLFLLLQMDHDLNQMKYFFRNSIKNVGSEFIILSIFKILNLIPLNQNEATFISNNIILRKHIADLIQLIVHAGQLDIQESFVKFFWETACYKQAIFDYLSIEHTSIFVTWLLDKNLIDKNFTIGETSLVRWAIEKGDGPVFFHVVDASEKFGETDKISGLFSGNLDICKFIFKNASVAKLQYFLGQAIKSNHLHIVQWFFAQGVKPKLKEDALYVLAKNKNFLMIEELLKQGVVIQPYMILRLIDAHDHELLGYLLSQHADKLIELDFNGLQLTSYLVQTQNVEFLELLLMHNISIEFKTTDDIKKLAQKAINSNCQLLSKHLIDMQQASPELFELAKQNQNIGLLKHMINKFGLNKLVSNQHDFINWVASKGFYQLLEPIFQKNKKILNDSIALVLASRKGRVNSVKRLLSFGVDVNACDENGESALTWASYEGFARVVKYLLESQQIDINHKNKTGLLALNNCILQKRCKIANMLLMHGAQFNQEEFNQLVELACIKNNPKLLETLKNLKKGRIKITEEHIWLAINANAKDVLDLLLSKNKTINLRVALVYAINVGKLGIVKLLTKHGANLNEIFPDGTTPLILALQNNQSKIVDFLLENDVDVDISYQNESALDFAIDCKNTKALIKIIRKSSITKEEYVKYIEKISMLPESRLIYRELIRKGLNLDDLPEHDLSSLLEIIIKKDDAIALEVFLKDQPHIETAIVLSARYQSKQCFDKLLANLQSFPNWVDTSICSPLIWAIRNQNQEMVSVLTHQFNCPYLGNFPIEFSNYLRNFQILKTIYEKQFKNLSDAQLQQITLALAGAAQNQKLSEEDSKLLQKALVNIPQITDIWGNSILDYCDDLDVVIKALQQSKDLSTFKPEILEKCFKTFLVSDKEHLPLIQKMVLHQPNLLMLTDNPNLVEGLFDKKILSGIEILLYQLEPGVKLDFHNKQQLIQAIQKINDLKHKYSIGDEALIDLNLFKSQLNRFLKLKKFDEFIDSVIYGLSQQNVFTSLFFGVSEHIKKIKTIYDKLSPEERLAYFEKTAMVDENNNPLLKALSFTLYGLQKQEPKTIQEFKKLIQSQRNNDN